MIKFNKDNHTYTNQGELYTSVTKLIGKFKNPFNRDHWSTYKALERLFPPKLWKETKKGWDVSKTDFIAHASTKFLKELGSAQDLNIAIDTILKEWKGENQKAIQRGNHYHLAKEKQSYKQGYEISPFDGKKYYIDQETIKLINPSLSLEEQIDADHKEGLVYDLFLLPDGYYPELLIWNNEYKLAGQADRVFIKTKRKHRYISIDDYKSNKKIKTKSIYNKAKRGYMMMKPPLNHLMDCNHTHYNLQISLYAWMLEQFGYKVDNLAFHHFNTMYQLKYLKKEIKTILKTK